MSDDLLSMFAALDEVDDNRTHYIRSPLHYPGCKDSSLDHILSYLPYMNTFCDVFAGSGSMTLGRRSSPLEVFNDRDSGITSFFRCFLNRDTTDQLIEHIKLIPHGRELFYYVRDNWAKQNDDVIRAAMFYSMIQQSFGGKGAHFGRVIKGKSDIWRKVHAGLDLFPMIHERFKKIQIENLDWRIMLKDFDSYETVFYLDPPYLGLQPYRHTMTKADHVLMCETIFNLKGFVALSGYDDNDVYDRFPWDAKHSFTIKDNMARVDDSSKSVREQRQEHLWIKEVE